jgi:hypothetical protein
MDSVVPICSTPVKPELASQADSELEATTDGAVPHHRATGEAAVAAGADAEAVAADDGVPAAAVDAAGGAVEAGAVAGGVVLVDDPQAATTAATAARPAMVTSLFMRFPSGRA